MMLAGETCAGCTATDNHSYPWAASFATAKSVIDAAIAAAEKILRATAKGKVADDLIAKGIEDIKAKLH